MAVHRYGVLAVTVLHDFGDKRWCYDPVTDADTLARFEKDEGRKPMVLGGQGKLLFLWKLKT